MSAGSLGFGYRVDPNQPGSRQLVDTKADLVRRVFSFYADGMPPRTIATKLDAEGIPGPGGRVWSDTTIRGQVERGTGILNKMAYAGRVDV